ncbi:unnamed protein product [Mytilus edulis]|uniref:Reverse transcriptase domain-containing protein n=1 Tax=Mytilus edulis TaxID=6550 RepID=A0A8S3RPK7_MYTED|nr:unnamed protein product [Mytilus edulis]
MSYRGITLAPTSYKLYCGVLNSRLTVKLDDLNFIHDEQNGFRSNRNTIDHLSTITTIIETRKMCKMSTFAAFIDFKKAYDTVNRFLLFCKLESIGISSKMLNALKSLYHKVQSCVKVNGNLTQWFDVQCGFKTRYLKTVALSQLSEALAKGIREVSKQLDDILQEADTKLQESEKYDERKELFKAAQELIEEYSSKLQSYKDSLARKPTVAKPKDKFKKRF